MAQAEGILKTLKIPLGFCKDSLRESPGEERQWEEWSQDPRD